MASAIQSWELAYVITDPQGKVAGDAEFFDAQGLKFKLALSLRARDSSTTSDLAANRDRDRRHVMSPGVP